MKKTIAITILTAAIGFTAACSKSPDKVLPKKDGTWNVSIKIQQYPGANLTYDMTYIFKDDGTVTFQLDGQTSLKSYSWVYSRNTKKITISGLDGSYPEIYNVIEMKAKSEKWQQTDIEAGVATTVDITLTKK